MAKRSLLIAPRLRLPSKPMKKRRAGRSRQQTVVTCLRVLACSLVAVDVGNMAFWYFAAWSARIVAFVVIFVVWNNAVSETMRHKTRQAWDRLNTATVQAVRAAPRRQSGAVKSARIEDTAAYLLALKVETVGYENIQTDRLYDTVPDNICYCDNICDTQTAPLR